MIYILHSLYWGALLTSIAAGALLKVDRAKIEAHFQAGLKTFDFFISTAPIMLPLATVGVAVSAALLKQTVPSRVELAVKSLLDGFKREFSSADEPDLQHRVTLFKHHAFCLRLIFRGTLPWRGALVPYERSGEYRLRSSTVLLAPKDDPDKSEGFAGLVFKRRVCEAINNLPTVDKNSNEGTVTRYGDDTNIAKEWIEAKRKSGYIFPRSFWGIPVEVDGGRIWGVLLIDSRAESLPKNSDALKKLFRPYGACLSKLFKGSHS